MDLRIETLADIPVVEALYESNPVKQEKGVLLKKLRMSVKYDALLSFVAEKDNEIIAHILFFPISISHNRCRNWTIVLATSVVKPELKQKGYFTEFLKYTLQQLREKEYKSVLVHGHSLFYHRFGFVNVQEYGMVLPQDKIKDKLEMMALALQENGLSGMDGSIQFTHEFG